MLKGDRVEFFGDTGTVDSVVEGGVNVLARSSTGRGQSLYTVRAADVRVACAERFGEEAVSRVELTAFARAAMDVRDGETCRVERGSTAAGTVWGAAYLEAWDHLNGHGDQGPTGPGPTDGIGGGA